MIYIVEDEPAVRDLILYTLNTAGLEAKAFGDGKAFWSAMSEKIPALIMLDIMLPGEDGFSLLKRLRGSKKTERLPVIMLTARGGEYDKVLGLESGADDYLVKPVGMMELVARAKALLRRVRPEKDDETLMFKDICVNIPGHSVTVGEQEVSLTLKEFDLLVYLLKKENTVFSREQLLKDVWGFDYMGETRTVDTHILTLRGKLRSAGELIKTVRGLGYKIGDGA